MLIICHCQKNESQAVADNVRLFSCPMLSLCFYIVVHIRSQDGLDLFSFQPIHAHYHVYPDRNQLLVSIAARRKYLFFVIPFFNPSRIQAAC
jgi:hypothetical protein